MDGALGAERADLDFRGVDVAALRRALHAHKLLVFRDQELTPASFSSAAARLGPLDVYPYAEPLAGHPHVVRVLKEAGDDANFGGAWHTDMPYVAEPPAITLLYAVQVPATGGDTLFADMVAAFERCSPGFQHFLRGLVGLHTAGLIHGAGGAHAKVAGQSVAVRPDAAISEAGHPLVLSDGPSGRNSLYFSLVHTSHFRGMTRQESLPLLEQLHRLATAAENTTRLRWRPGTLAVWDNRAVQHYPLNDYPGQRREMHRIVLKGDRPGGGPGPGKHETTT